MKTILFILLLLPTLAFSQRFGGGRDESAKEVYSKSNFTTSLLDTTNYIPVGEYAEFGFVFKSTDSVSADIYIDGLNSVFSGVATTNYADSLIGTSNTSNTNYVTVKSTTLNRFPMNDLIRFRVDHRASGAGTTTGRTLKIYLVGKKW